MDIESKATIECLNEGRRMEEIVMYGNKSRFFELLRFFIELTSLHEAIQSAISMRNFESQIKGKLIKQTAYPLFIFVFSFVTIYLFSNYIIPQLLNNFEASETYLFDIVIFIKNISVLLVGVLLISLCFLVLFKYSYKLKILFCEKTIFMIPFIKSVVSYYLSSYLIELQSKGLSTKQAFKFLMGMNEKSLLNYVVLGINERLCNGIDLSVCINENRFLSKGFKLHYVIGSSTNNYEKSLNDFCNYQEKRWFQLIKRISTTVQIMSYSLVGVLVICVYQIMLIPLQMLENF